MNLFLVQEVCNFTFLYHGHEFVFGVGSDAIYFPGTIHLV